MMGVAASTNRLRENGGLVLQLLDSDSNPSLVSSLSSASTAVISSIPSTPSICEPASDGIARKSTQKKRMPKFRFHFDGKTLAPTECPADGENYKKRFEEFLVAVKEVSHVSYTSGWRLDCYTRKGKSDVVDLYFFDRVGKCYRSSSHFIKEFQRELEQEMEGRDESEEDEKVVIKRRKPSTRVAKLRKKMELESMPKRILRSRVKDASNGNGQTAKAPVAKKSKHEIDLERLIELVDDSQKVLVVLGAGVSTAAGLPDFRTKSSGMYATLARQGKDSLPAELIFHGEMFKEDPVPFYEFASRTFLPLVEKAKPTLTHQFVSALAEDRKLLRCYTQNVDGLERLAGLPEKYLVECHGTMRTARCLKCYKRRSDPYWWKTDSVANKGVPECNQKGCNGDMKPDMIFFGEQVSGKIDQRLYWDVDKCDLVLVIGTSLSVQPVCEILSSVPEEVPRVWINRADPPEDRDFEVALSGDCEDVAKTIMKKLKWLK